MGYIRTKDKRYEKISHQQASDCIKCLQEQAHSLGCYESEWAITNGYE